MKSWRMNWAAIFPLFKFSLTLTTNAIESLNATYRQMNRQRSVFWTYYKKVNYAFAQLGLNLRRVIYYFRGSFALLTSRFVFFTEIFPHFPNFWAFLPSLEQISRRSVISFLWTSASFLYSTNLTANFHFLHNLLDTAIIFKDHSFCLFPLKSSTTRFFTLSRVKVRESSFRYILEALRALNDDFLTIFLTVPWHTFIFLMIIIKDF